MEALEPGRGSLQTAKPKRRSEARAAALAALEQAFEPRRTPATYRLSLMLVCAFVVAMPLVYVGIVGATGWGLYWYARHGAELLADASGRGYAIGRFGPLVVGGILFFFLLKPLLARPTRRPRPLSLDATDEPFLFEFVDRLAECLDAPAPDRIDVNLDVNASASFASGLRSLVDGKLALTIGLPLTSTLSLREFTAVLAHEFGHFSQGAGMRFYYLTQTVNHWFARVVFLRDAWDLRLERWSQGGWWIGIAVLNAARFCVGLSRRILLVLLKTAAAASSLMSRQMEFDADQNAIRLCGSDSFARSMQLLPQAEAARQWAAAVNNMALRDGRLSDDLPALIGLGLRELPEELLARCVNDDAEATPDMYASHPPRKERVARAMELDVEGTFDVDGPSSLLFRDYPELCGELTARLYGIALDEEHDALSIVPAASILSLTQKSQRDATRVGEYFLGQVVGPTTLALEPLQPSAPERPKRALTRLQNLRHELSALVSLDTGECAEQYSRFLRASAAEELLSAGLRVTDADFAASSKKVARMALEANERRLDALRQQSVPFAEVLRNRIAVTLDLLCLPQVQGRVEGAAELCSRAQRAVELLALLPGVSNAMHELQNHLGTTAELLPQLEGQDPERTGRILSSRARRMRACMAAAREQAGELVYPYEHVRGTIPLADYLVAALPADAVPWDAQMEVAQSSLEVWSRLLNALLADVANAGLAAEKGMQLEPLRPPR